MRCCMCRKKCSSLRALLCVLSYMCSHFLCVCSLMSTLLLLVCSHMSAPLRSHLCVIIVIILIIFMIITTRSVSFCPPLFHVSCQDNLLLRDAEIRVNGKVDTQTHVHVHRQADRQTDIHVCIYIYIDRFLQRKRETLRFLPSGSDTLLVINSSSGSAVMALLGCHLWPSLP